MPHYVKKLWEKFLLPITILYRRHERLAYKNFYARGSGGERRTKTLNLAEKSFFVLLVDFIKVKILIRSYLLKFLDFS
jgi:hypothetical protein